jgi:hypothetical protein
MRREQMGRKFGLHDMAALPAELSGLHVLDSAIGQLASDDEIRHGHDCEKNAGAPIGGPAIGNRPEPLGRPAPSERDPDRNQRKSRKEHDGYRDEYQQPDIGIADISTNILRQRKQPRESGECHQRHGGHRV